DWGRQGGIDDAAPGAARGRRRDAEVERPVPGVHGHVEIGIGRRRLAAELLAGEAAVEAERQHPRIVAEIGLVWLGAVPVDVGEGGCGDGPRWRRRGQAERMGYLDYLRPVPRP